MSRFGKKEEELSGHTGRTSKRQQVRRPFSRCGDSEWSWFCERDLHVHHGLIDGLGLDQPRQQGNLLCSGDWIQLRRICAHVSKKLLLTSAAQIVKTSAREPAPRSAGPRAHVGSLHAVSGQLQRLRTKTLVVGPRRGWRLLPECARTFAFATPAVLFQPGSLCKGLRLSHWAVGNWAALRTAKVFDGPRLLMAEWVGLLRHRPVSVWQVLDSAFLGNFQIFNQAGTGRGRVSSWMEFVSLASTRRLVRTDQEKVSLL